jgi:hypothetical protein
MPLTPYRRHVVSAVVWGALGLMLVGWGVGQKVSSSPPAAVTLTRAGSIQTIPVTHTHIVKRVVKGKVRRLRGGTRVVFVPRVVVLVRGCHRTQQNRCARHVVVPAHRIRLRRATIHNAVATAAVLPVTVTIVVPTTVYRTVTSPAQTFTATETTTATSTETDVVTVTVTVPIPPGGTP